MKFQEVYNLFFTPGEVVEIRAYGLSKTNKAWEGWAGGTGIVYGYFDNPESFAEAATALEKAKAPGIYFTLNPCLPDLLARAANRLKAAGAKTVTTSDKEIAFIRWLPIDLDPKRPSGISSTDDELKKAITLRNKIYKYLVNELKWPPGIPAVSGNGAHLVFKLDPAIEIKNRDNVSDDPGPQEIKQCLLALAHKFGSKEVDVDISVFNPARIWKLYGTSARKGDHTDLRPHRKSYIERKFLKTTPDHSQVIGADEKLRKALAVMAPKDAETEDEYQRSDKSQKSQPRASQETDLGEFDVEKYLTAHGITFNVKHRGDRTLYRLDHCLFDPSHGKNDAYIQRTPGSPLIYHCSHQSCNHTWKEARYWISKDQSLAPYMSGYDPHFKKAKSEKRSESITTQEMGSGILDKIIIDYEPPAGVLDSPAVPPPNKIDPREFFRKNMQGKVAFIPRRMAFYYAAYLQNIIHTSDVFWHYSGGVWKRFSHFNLMKIAVNALDDAIQPTYLRGTIDLLRGLVNKEHEEWPAWNNQINCLNGMVDIETGKLKPHDPKYLSVSQLPCKYGWEHYEEEVTPWLDFLEAICPGEEDKKSIIQQFFGYCLLQDCRYEKALFLKGEGGNGKGTLVHMLREMLGNDNCSSLTMEHIADPRFSLYFLQGKLLNEITELSHRKGIETELFKKIVSGEKLTVERKYGDKYEYEPYVKFVISMNNLPIIPDTSYGFKRRLLVVNLNQKFEQGVNADPLLKRKLVRCRDAVFMWSLMGLEKIMSQNKFVVGGKVREETEVFFEALDPATEFFQETLEAVPPDRKSALQVQEVYEKYVRWCKSVGHNPLNRRNFNSRLERYFAAEGVKKGPFGDTRRIHWINLEYKLEAM